jgi:hypothetical protein
MKNRVIYIKERKCMSQDFQFYMHQFIESGKNAGMLPLKDVSSPKHLFRRIMPFILFVLNYLKLFKLRRKVLITTSRGDGILEAAYPHYLNYQIIPMLWDTWPKEQERLFKDLRILKCPLALVTARQMAERIKQELNIKTLWVPEGINTQGFITGDDLYLRPIDVYELGRQHLTYHRAIENAIYQGSIKTWKGNTYNADGTLKLLACKCTEELKKTLSSSKVVICFPKSDTDKADASGGIETLTQRYWEVMLSRSVIIGRAPKELIDLIGYNPVIDVDWDAPEKQIAIIISHISNYQSLVDKNYATACKIASWDNRMEMIKSFIKENLN